MVRVTQYTMERARFGAGIQAAQYRRHKVAEKNATSPTHGIDNGWKYLSLNTRVYKGKQDCNLESIGKGQVCIWRASHLPESYLTFRSCCDTCARSSKGHPNVSSQGQRQSNRYEVMYQVVHVASLCRTGQIAQWIQLIQLNQMRMMHECRAVAF